MRLRRVGRIERAVRRSVRRRKMGGDESNINGLILTNDWYTSKNIFRTRTTHIYLFGANYSHLKNRSESGGANQAAETAGNSNVVPVITMSYDSSLSEYVDFYFEIVRYIVINFYTQGGTVVFPVKEYLNPQNISIGTGLATDISYAEGGRNFAIELYSELLNMHRQPTSQAMETFNAEMNMLESNIRSMNLQGLQHLLRRLSPSEVVVIGKKHLQNNESLKKFRTYTIKNSDTRFNTVMYYNEHPYKVVQGYIPNDTQCRFLRELPNNYVMISVVRENITVLLRSLSASDKTISANTGLPPVSAAPSTQVFIGKHHLIYKDRLEIGKTYTIKNYYTQFDTVRYYDKPSNRVVKGDIQNETLCSLVEDLSNGWVKISFVTTRAVIVPAKCLHGTKLKNPPFADVLCYENLNKAVNGFGHKLGYIPNGTAYTRIDDTPNKGYTLIEVNRHDIKKTPSVKETPSDWACRTCTFLNNHSLGTCKMCGTNKPN